MRFIFIICLFFLAVSVTAQPAIVITDADVEIRFPTATDNAWKPADVLSITYSSEDLGEHISIARLGVQTWEGWMCDSTDEAKRKYVIQIQVRALPSPQSRDMELRIRCRYDDDSAIGPWSEPEGVKIQGKPKHIGE